ncbi:MAG TPA: hypothetical protein VMM37_02920 [Bacteroidota bacterium]|nr:hypothetical protein [Bacteroidota bacterium]
MIVWRIGWHGGFRLPTGDSSNDTEAITSTRSGLAINMRQTRLRVKMLSGDVVGDAPGFLTFGIRAKLSPFVCTNCVHY